MGNLRTQLSWRGLELWGGQVGRWEGSDRLSQISREVRGCAVEVWETQFSLFLLLSLTGHVRFIDYEYAGYNYQAFDIGNHFNEFAGREVCGSDLSALLTMGCQPCGEDHTRF